jgi:hypothetical protein
MYKGKRAKDKQWSTKHTHKTKDRVTRTPLKTGGELGKGKQLHPSCYSSYKPGDKLWALLTLILAPILIVCVKVSIELPQVVTHQQFAITASNNAGSHDIAAKLLKMSISSHVWGLTFYSHEQNTCMTAWAHWEGMRGPMKINWSRYFLIEVTISNQETEQICIYVLGVAILCMFL